MNASKWSGDVWEVVGAWINRDAAAGLPLPDFGAVAAQLDAVQAVRDVDGG